MWTQTETPSSWWGTILATPTRRRPGYVFIFNYFTITTGYNGKKTWYAMIQFILNPHSYP